MNSHCYSWTGNDYCLYYKDTLACLKAYGAIFVNEKVIKYVQAPIKNAGLEVFVFEDNIENFSPLLTKACRLFKQYAYNDGTFPDEFIIRILHCLKNVKYENKYLNYCKGLNLAQLSEIARKRAARAKSPERKLVLNGLWYH